MNTNDNIFELTQTWGWSTPPDSILTIAEETIRACQIRTGEFLVSIDALTQDAFDKLLAAKPRDLKTLEWCAQQYPHLTPYVDRVLAAQARIPFYPRLDESMTLHACMHEAGIKVYAEQIDAIVMMIQDTIPVLVFSSFGSLLEFRSLGRAEQHDNPIVQRFGHGIKLAVSARDEISVLLRGVLAHDDLQASGQMANTWIGESAENREKPANRFITRLIDHALHIKATDIGLVPQRDGSYIVQLRSFGDLIAPRAVSHRLDAETSDQILMLLQSKSGANPSNTTQRTPTNGQISYRSASGDAFLRLSFIPLNHLGEMRNLTSIAARVLPRSDTHIDLNALKLHEAALDQLAFAMRLGKGMVVVAGPTNSGKSTTVAGAIGLHCKLYGDRRKRLSVEEPIERFLPDITQLNVPLHDGREQGFTDILRALKRHDPDFIWVGEVQDSLTAETCVAQASTGHLVATTLHASDCVTAFDVLAKMVPEEKRFQMIEACTLFVNQRLAQRLCPHCKVAGEPNAEERRLFEMYCQMVGDQGELPAQVARSNPDGCERCHGRGHHDLLPLTEVLPFTREARNAATALVQGVGQRADLARFRTLTMLDSGLRLIAAHEIEINSIFE